MQAEFLPFFVFGLLSGYGFRFWLLRKHHVLIHLVLLYVFVVGFGGIGLIVLFQPTTHKVFFILGACVPFLKKALSMFGYVLDEFFQGIREKRARKQINKKRKRQERRSNQEAKQNNQARQKNQSHEQQDRTRQEQAKREEEIRQYREQQRQKEKPKDGSHTMEDQQQNKREQAKERPEQPKAPPPREPAQEVKKAQENRIYEQILGLSADWTQDDLKRAYRHQCQQLHPDKWEGKPKEIKAIMEAEYKAVQEAYKKLKK